MTYIIPQGDIEKKIYLIRGVKVMFDRDLAELYDVETKALNQAVKRNNARFPEDFMFQLTNEELLNWKSQIVTSNPAIKMGLRRRPFVFTENGVSMLSSVLSSERAIQVNIIIMRTFTKFRELVYLHKEIAQKLSQLERKYERHDEQIQAVFDQIRELVSVKDKPKRRIGFEQEK